MTLPQEQYTEPENMMWSDIITHLSNVISYIRRIYNNESRKFPSTNYKE
jgi:hypothetical protein